MNITEEYRSRVIYCCVVGSQAFGLATQSSDVDRRGIYLPTASQHWSLHGCPEQMENNATQEVYWELQKFLNLALKANPNILECLFTPIVEVATPLARELLALRSVFLSRRVFQTFNHYAQSQLKKIHLKRQKDGITKWKQVMHLLRLLISGANVLRTGRLDIEVREQRERLLAVKQGQLSWADIEAWRNALQKEFEEAHANTSLPESPHVETVNEFLLKARHLATHPELP